MKIVTPLLLSLLILSGSASAIPVSPAEVSLVQLSVDGGVRSIGCYQDKPGVVSARNGSVRFRSFSQIIRRLKRRGDAGGVLRNKRLRRNGKIACAPDSAAVKTPLSEVGSLSTSATAVLAPVGLIANSVFVVASGLGGPAVQSSLQDIADALEDYFPCATVTLNGLSVTVDFGGGCFVHSVNIAGSFTGTLALSGELEFVLDGLVVNDSTVDGTIAVSLISPATAALDGLSVAFDLTMLTSGGKTITLTFDGTGSGDDDGVTLDGDGDFDDGSNEFDFTATELHKSFDGTCYPDGGSLTLKPNGSPNVVVTFTADTPNSGEATVQVGNLAPTTETLPDC